MADPQTTPTNFPQDALRRTVIDFPTARDETMVQTYTWFLHSVGQRIVPWGSGYMTRDRQLRDFWPIEPYIAGAVYGASIRNANYEWEIEGPDDGVIGYYTDMLNACITNTNFGWLEFIKTISQEWLTQDNGMFIEIVRDPTIDAASRFKGENAPVVGLAHLDSGKCLRTGNPKKPVIYEDRRGKKHNMMAYEIVPLAEFQSPIQKMNGVGFSAISRILKMAEIISSIQIYTDEKVSGRHIKQIHFVGGVSKMEIEDIKRVDEEHADNEGLMRYIQPMIYASLDPEKPVTTASIDLASIPDHFDFDTLMRWYIANIALNMGSDYQDLAPLPSGNIGSSSQSEILHRKSRGKGPANFMETIQNIMRDYGIIPKGYEFKFKVKDLSEEAERAELQKNLVEMLAILRRADGIDGTTLRKALEKFNILESEILNLTPDDFGNEPSLTRTENMLGQVGDSTIGEDAQRQKKGIVGRILDVVKGDGE